MKKKNYNSYNLIINIKMPIDEIEYYVFSNKFDISIQMQNIKNFNDCYKNIENPVISINNLMKNIECYSKSKTTLMNAKMHV